MSDEWRRGRNPGFDVVAVEVLVRRDEHGRVISAHDLQSDEGRGIVAGWPSGGMEQVAFALLVEAVKREAVLDVLLRASHDPSFLGRWKSAGSEEREPLLQEMVKALRVGMAGTVARVAETAVRGALEQATSSC